MKKGRASKMSSAPVKHPPAYVKRIERRAERRHGKRMLEMLAAWEVDFESLKRLHD